MNVEDVVTHCEEWVALVLVLILMIVPLLILLLVLLRADVS